MARFTYAWEGRMKIARSLAKAHEDAIREAVLADAEDATLEELQAASDVLDRIIHEAEADDLIDYVRNYVEGS